MNNKNLTRKIEVKNILINRTNELKEILQSIINNGIDGNWFKIDGTLKKKHSNTIEQLRNLDKKGKVSIDGIEYFVSFYSAFISNYEHRDDMFTLKSRICVSGDPDKNNVNKYCNYEDICIYFKVGEVLNPEPLVNGAEIIKTIEKKNALREELKNIDCPYLYWFDN